MTPADESSEFYDTPLATETPVKEQEPVHGTVDPDALKPIETKSTIPGLSFVNNPPQAAQNGAENIPQSSTVATDTSNDDTTMGGTVQSPPKSSDLLENQQLAIVDGEQQAPPPSINGNPDMSSHETNGQGENGEAEGEGEHPEWEVDSSPIESSSESSSDDSSDSSEDSDDDEGEEDYPILSAEETARILMQAGDASDDEGDARGRSGNSLLKTTNEQLEEALPIPDITVTPEMKIELLGRVETIVENIVLIKASTSGEYQVLESNSLLCLENRTVIGLVAETLGRVEEPLYTLRYGDAAKITDFGLSPGTPIFYVVDHSTFVFTQPLKGLKGSDASNLHDEEVGDEEVEFSDDEAEAEYKRRLKQKRKEKRGGASNHTGPGPSRLNQAELNYDDASGLADSVDEGYTPLARPKNYHEMMTSHQQGRSDPSSHSHSRGGSRGGRGRARGFDRGSQRGGRGGRGRGRGSWDSSHSPRERGSYNDHRAPLSPNYQSQTAHVPASNYSSQSSPYQTSPPHPSYGSYSPQQHQYPQQNQYSNQNTQNISQFPLQMPYQQQQQQQQPFPQFPAGAHINPAFFAALQQAQQQPQQSQGPQQYPQQPYQSPSSQQQQQQYPPQISQEAFNQVKAQLDLLRQLSGNNNPTGGQPQ